MKNLTVVGSSREDFLTLEPLLDLGEVQAKQNSSRKSDYALFWHNCFIAQLELRKLFCKFSISNRSLTFLLQLLGPVVLQGVWQGSKVS